MPVRRLAERSIFDRHLDEFCDVYDEKYAAQYGMFRLERIRDMGARFMTCGDYRLGVARIRCTNPACGHDYFTPFSCKGFYLSPSCSQKRTLLFAEHLTNEVLLDVPHRQFVFTMPKALRPFFRHDRRLFAEVSRLIYTIISEFYAAATSKPLLTGVVTAFQSFGDQLRWNAHFHSLVIEGGFDEAARFIHIPLSGLGPMTEVFRTRLIWLLVEKKLLAEDFAQNLLSARLLSCKNIGLQYRQLSPPHRCEEQGESCRVHRSASVVAKEDPLRAVQGEGTVPHEVLRLFQTNAPRWSRTVHLFDALEFLAEAHVTKPPAASSGSSAGR
jgi:hypothetical protein